MQEYKIILVGENGVGKTSTINRLLTGSFNTNIKTDQKINVYTSYFNETKINIWDIDGNTYGKDMYYIGSNAAIIMFDVTNPKSLISVKQYIKDINNICENIPIIILGNKKDSFTQKVEYSNIKQYIKKYPYVDFCAKWDTDTEIKKPFERLVSYVNCN